MSLAGSILEYYDNDKQIPLYGFGGKYFQEVNHCFALNGDIFKPEVAGINGVLQTYQKVLSRGVELWGPTHFSDVIKQTREYCQHIKKTQASRLKYTILLILTDGEVTDEQDTIEELVAASDLPLSIVIVGIGPSEFGKMERLDADREPLVSKKGVSQKRDYVQFVNFRKHASNMESLQKEVLKEIPKQLSDYYQSMNLSPSKSPSPP